MGKWENKFFWWILGSRFFLDLRWRSEVNRGSPRCVISEDAFELQLKQQQTPHMLHKQPHWFAEFEIAFSRLIPLRRCAGDPWVITTALGGLQERRLGSCGKPLICHSGDFPELVRPGKIFYSKIKKKISMNSTSSLSFSMTIWNFLIIPFLKCIRMITRQFNLQ